MRPSRARNTAVAADGAATAAAAAVADAAATAAAPAAAADAAATAADTRRASQPGRGPVVARPGFFARPPGRARLARVFPLHYNPRIRYGYVCLPMFRPRLRSRKRGLAMAVPQPFRGR